MELHDLQNNWDKQDNTQEIKNNIVIKLFKESRQNKVKSNLKKLVGYSILFMIFNLLVLVFAGKFAFSNYTNLGVVIPGVLLMILSAVVFLKNIAQLSDISKINYDLPVVQLQKIIERLKIKRVKHNRFIFIFSNIYFWLMVLLIFSLDFNVLISTVWQNAPLVIIIHTVLSILWYPLAFWLLKKYDQPDEQSKFWSKLKIDSYLTDQSVNFSLNNAQSFLNEIVVFEKD